ncbi:MAG: ROK family protein, partial [Muribaculaceae bacterium]|nr:ROK family protein [Muribaculaceae bacterium]
REYGKISGNENHGLTPYDIFLIAEGKKDGDSEAAKKAFAMFGEVAGDAIATAVTLTDSLVVIGGGITGAAKYIMPALLDEMRSSLHTLGGDEVQRVQLRVFDLDNELEFAKFALGDSRELKVYGSEETVIYDPMKRTGVAITRVGASKAIMIGAYAYALAQIDSNM